MILSSQQEKQLLNAFLLWYVYRYFHASYQEQSQHDGIQYSDQIMENYEMDGRIIRFMMSEMIEAGDYTLEGMANYAKIPLDSLIDLACGNNAAPSITLWTKIIGLYMQSRPNLCQSLWEKSREAMPNLFANIF